MYNPDRLKKIISSPVMYLILRLVLGGIFILSGSLKLMDTYKFAKILYDYGILPDYLINIVSIGLPVIEILAGTGLLFNMKYSLELITVMLFLFVGVLWFGILNDLNIDCGCFSSDEIIEQGSLYKALYRDFIFITISVFLFVSRRINKKNIPKFLFNYYK